MTFTTISLLEEDLKRDEGRATRPYKDTAGVLTIGYGHNLDAEGLCEEALLAQLRHDIQTKALPVYGSLPWLSSAPQGVQRALLNMAFNLGIEGLMRFSATLELLKTGQYRAAAAHLRRLPYAKQVKSRAERLAKLIEDAV